MIKPLCTICGKELLGGYQEIIYTKVDASDIPQEQKDELKKKPEQVEYFAHNPRDTHRDIRVYAHKTCTDKVKVAYPDFDKPTQIDLADVKYPIINSKTGVVELQNKDDFIKVKAIN